MAGKVGGAEALDLRADLARTAQAVERVTVANRVAPGAVLGATVDRDRVAITVIRPARTARGGWRPFGRRETGADPVDPRPLTLTGDRPRHADATATFPDLGALALLPVGVGVKGREIALAFDVLFPLPIVGLGEAAAPFLARLAATLAASASPHDLRLRAYTRDAALMEALAALPHFDSAPHPHTPREVDHLRRGRAAGADSARIAAADIASWRAQARRDDPDAWDALRFGHTLDHLDALLARRLAGIGDATEGAAHPSVVVILDAPDLVAARHDDILFYMSSGPACGVYVVVVLPKLDALVKPAHQRTQPLWLHTRAALVADLSPDESVTLTGTTDAARLRPDSAYLYAPAAELSGQVVPLTLSTREALALGRSITDYWTPLAPTVDPVTSPSPIDAPVKESIVEPIGDSDLDGLGDVPVALDEEPAAIVVHAEAPDSTDLATTGVDGADSPTEGVAAGVAIEEPSASGEPGPEYNLTADAAKQALLARLAQRGRGPRTTPAAVTESRAGTEGASSAAPTPGVTAPVSAPVDASLAEPEEDTPADTMAEGAADTTVAASLAPIAPTARPSVPTEDMTARASVPDGRTGLMLCLCAARPVLCLDGAPLADNTPATTRFMAVLALLALARAGKVPCNSDRRQELVLGDLARAYYATGALAQIPLSHTQRRKERRDARLQDLAATETADSQAGTTDVARFQTAVEAAIANLDKWPSLQRLALRRRGIDPDRFEDGDNALAMLRKYPPSALILTVTRAKSTKEITMASLTDDVAVDMERILALHGVVETAGAAVGLADALAVPGVIPACQEIDALYQGPLGGQANASYSAPAWLAAEQDDLRQIVGAAAALAARAAITTLVHEGQISQALDVYTAYCGRLAVIDDSVPETRRGAALTPPQDLVRLCDGLLLASDVPDLAPDSASSRSRRRLVRDAGAESTRAGTGKPEEGDTA